MLTGSAEAPPAPDAAIASARELARTAPTLEALRDLLEKFDGCALKSTATRLVFAEHYDDMRAARQRERNMKHWRRAWKVRLILDQKPDWDDLYDRLS